MDFDFPAIDDMANPNPQTAVSTLLNTAPPTPTAAHNPLAWGHPHDLPAMLPDARHDPHPIHPQPTLGDKRRHALLQPQPAPLPTDTNPTSSSAEDRLKYSTLNLNDSPDIELHVVHQMGGLPYADLVKERAREEFKEAKKNEHMANGDYDRMKRRKKGDTSMTPRQKYLRRLRMNQDSAAAARHAQDVYVNVLEKLVRTGEEERKAFLLELQQLRRDKDTLHVKVQQLNEKVVQLEEEHASAERAEAASHQDLFDAKKYDQAQLNKLIEMLYPQASVGAQADIGIQPARAV